MSGSDENVQRSPTKVANLFEDTDPFTVESETVVEHGDFFVTPTTKESFARPVDPTRWTILTKEEVLESERYLANLEAQLKNLRSRQEKGRKEVVDYSLPKRANATVSAWIQALEDDVNGERPAYSTTDDVTPLVQEQPSGEGSVKRDPLQEYKKAAADGARAGSSPEGSDESSSSEDDAAHTNGEYTALAEE